MAKKVGELIKEARTQAGMTQEALARKVAGVSANDISKAERGELSLTQEELKKIAKATGVTQKSLLEAASGSQSKKSSIAKSTSRSSSGSSVKVTQTEKKLLELYRDADSQTKKMVLNILKGEDMDVNDYMGAPDENYGGPQGGPPMGEFSGPQGGPPMGGFAGPQGGPPMGGFAGPQGGPPKNADSGNNIKKDKTAKTDIMGALINGAKDIFG